tara:strand:- start:899 stop:2173 length:1275 start_codon:yes stop_codon:yes gene_type:complete
MNRPILCSEILSALTQPKRALALYQGGRIADSKIRQKQFEFVDAKKFVISDNMIENAWDISLSKPSVILELLDYARVPFENVWFEWNENLRQEIMQNYAKKHGKEIDDTRPSRYPQRVGYHIKKFKNRLDEDYYLYENWWFTGENVVNQEKWSSSELPNKYFTPTMCFTLEDTDPNWEDAIARIQLLDEMPEQGRPTTPMDMMIQSFCVGTQLLGRNYSYKYIPRKFLLTLEEKQKLGNQKGYLKFLEKVIKYEGNHEFNCFKQICYRLSLAQSSSMHWSIPEWKFKEGYTMKEIQDHESTALVSMEGDTRFMISLLSLINQNLHEQEFVEPNSKIVHTVLGKRVPRNSYYVLNVIVPKSGIRKIYKTTFTGKGNPKREHERRGHMRHLRDKDGNVYKKIWIKDMVVGNAELGKVTKDYNFKSE